MRTEVMNEPGCAEVLRTIFERRAVRKYLRDMVDEDILEKILDAGRMAPSAMNRQPWKFYIATHRDTVLLFSKEIANVALKAMHGDALNHEVENLKTQLHFTPGPIALQADDAVFHGAPMVVFITSPRDNDWAGLDIGMCAQNMMLAARALGLDSCPIGMAKYLEQTPVYKKLEVPASERVLLAVVLGYGDENPVPHARLRNDTLFIDRMECV